MDDLKDYSNEELVDYFHGIQLAGTGARGRHYHDEARRELLRRLQNYVPPVKTTSITYCGECLDDFYEGQEVWFAWIENDCFCSHCKEDLDIEEFEKRKVVWNK